jgi:hypothetical protein
MASSSAIRAQEALRGTHPAVARHPAVSHATFAGLEPTAGQVEIEPRSPTDHASQRHATLRCDNRGPHRTGRTAPLTRRSRKEPGSPGFRRLASLRSAVTDRTELIRQRTGQKTLQTNRFGPDRDTHKRPYCLFTAQSRGSTARSGQEKTPDFRGFFIGAPGFEPGTSPTRTARATRLRHAPTHAEVSHTHQRGSVRPVYA